MSFHRGPYGGGQQVTFAFPPVTPMVKQILIFLAACFAVQVFLESLFGMGLFVREWLSLVPAYVFGRVAIWQLVTYGALHGGIFHLLMNALGLWMFGGEVERVLGSRGFLRFFVVCVAGGGLLHTIVALLFGGDYALVPTVGASAGVLGVLVAFAVFFPQRQLMLLFPPIPVKAWVLALIVGAIDLYNALTTIGARSGFGPATSRIAVVAHLGGMLTAYLYIKGFIKPGGWPRVRFGKRDKGFRVVRGGQDDRYDVH